MLQQKLNPTELTYGRYLGMAEQVYLGALDNLQNVANTLKMLTAIDLNYTKQRLQQLQNNGGNNGGNNSNHGAKEIASLQERIALHQKQTEKVTTLLAQNEEAMTKIDVTIAAIADMRTEDGQATLDIETAMNELQRLASKAKEYSTLTVTKD
jgi:septal ring factor EnvC (AmiA/AmiB activator)